MLVRDNICEMNTGISLPHWSAWFVPSTINILTTTDYLRFLWWLGRIMQNIWYQIIQNNPNSDDCVVPSKKVQSKTRLKWRFFESMSDIWLVFCAGCALYLMWEPNRILEFINKFCKKEGKELSHWLCWDTPLFIYICCYFADTNNNTIQIIFSGIHKCIIDWHFKMILKAFEFVF